MSAFICGADHFKALALFAAARTGGYGMAHLRVDPRYVQGLTHPQHSERGLENFTERELASLYADVLYQENVRSVAYRYEDTPRDKLPGPLADSGFVGITNRDIVERFRLAPVAILKMCDCLEYQSCETPDYRESVAWNLLGAIRKAAIRELPGYEEAPWDFEAPEPAPRGRLAA